MDNGELRVLLIEDDEDDFLLTSELLKEIPGEKISLDWAKHFDDGLAAMLRSEHDAYLLDYRLGKNDGLMLLREALDRGCKAPIILLTGQGDRDLALQALEAGAADYLVKGEIDASALDRSIRYALQQKRHAQQLEAKVVERTRQLEKVNVALRESEARVRGLFEKAEAARVSAQEARVRAEAATRAKDDFLAALSHELRTPLNPALLLATALADDKNLPPRVREDVDVIAKSIALQAQLVDDLLDITRISSGKLHLDLRPLDAHVTLRRAVEIVRAEMEERKIDIVFDLTAEQHCILADAVRVQQVFWNVLKNAVKFTPHRGNIRVHTSNPAIGPSMLEIAIIDTGIGIEPHMLRKVFDAFTQEDHPPHRFGGVGLGLAITRRLVELQNGKIVAESRGRDRGATFRIELPLAADPGACIEVDSGQTPSAPSMPIARRILLVEDHEQTRRTLTQLLERRGHVVVGVDKAAEAREKAAEREFDLVISDLGLPDGDGHSLMAQLRDKHQLQGIALTGYGMEEDLALSRKSGFFAHLTKPVDIRALESAIASAPLRATVATSA